MVEGVFPSTGGTMARDYAALTGALETDDRYDDAVQKGCNTGLVALLNADKPTGEVFDAVDTDDFLEAVGDGLSDVTDATALSKLRLLLSRDTVPLNRSAVRGELQKALPASAATRIRTAFARPPRYCEDFGFALVALDDVRGVLPSIAKSYVSTRKVAQEALNGG